MPDGDMAEQLRSTTFRWTRCRIGQKTELSKQGFAPERFVYFEPVSHLAIGGSSSAKHCLGHRVVIVEIIIDYDFAFVGMRPV